MAKKNSKNGSKNSLKVLGMITTVGGAILGIIGGMIDEKKQNDVIEEKVAEALAKKGH